MNSMTIIIYVPLVLILLIDVLPVIWSSLKMIELRSVQDVKMDSTLLMINYLVIPTTVHRIHLLDQVMDKHVLP